MLPFRASPHRQLLQVRSHVHLPGLAFLVEIRLALRRPTAPFGRIIFLVKQLTW